MVDVHLPADSQRRLIQIARETIEDFVRAWPCGRAESGDPCLETDDYDALVTLVKEDELHGCIGTRNPSGSLRHPVTAMTEASASRGALLPQVATERESEMKPSWNRLVSRRSCRKRVALVRHDGV